MFLCDELLKPLKMYLVLFYFVHLSYTKKITLRSKLHTRYLFRLFTEAPYLFINRMRGSGDRPLSLKYHRIPSIYLVEMSTVKKKYSSLLRVPKTCFNKFQLLVVVKGKYIPWRQTLLVFTSTVKKGTLSFQELRECKNVQKEGLIEVHFSEVKIRYKIITLEYIGRSG